MNMKYGKKSQRGFTMVELAVSLVIIGVLTAGIYSVISGKVDTARATAIAEELVQSAVNIQNRHATQPAGTRYNGLTLSTASMALTENMRNSLNTGRTQITLEWGASATLAPSGPTGATGSSTNQKWTISNLPRTQCEAMLSTMAGPSLVVQNSANAVVRSRMANDPLTPAEVEAICAADSATNSFSVVF